MMTTRSLRGTVQGGRSAQTATVVMNRAAARRAGLRYVAGTEHGIRRIHRGGGFVYIDRLGQRIADPQTLARIKSLAIPPAWEGVWICPNPLGHIQAVGRDARGRKQYRYHPRWREARDDEKYRKLIGFARALPRIRQALHRDLKRPGLPRAKVLAAVVRILERTLIRIGNEEYATSNGSYGLTTFHDRHAKIGRGWVRFKFRGKSGLAHEIDLEDPRLVQIIRHCRDLPGEQLLQYVDGHGEVRDITSRDVNDYLRQIGRGEFTAKDFRTWTATVLAARALRELGPWQSRAQAKRNIRLAVETVAKRLGNTSVVCRRCYIHPVVFEAYLDGSLVRQLGERAQRTAVELRHRLCPEEAAVLVLLRRKPRRDARPRRTHRHTASVV
ncbi:DNA topoisomerase IB [Fontivita pretiosa]|uniref:DNA topoisomerase IB n=1 Tax=Fontivita pretiosa TaxID=2989684 RepID=UPI003D172EFE